MSRDNFSDRIVKLIGMRAGYICTNPLCRKLTIGPNQDNEKSLSIGVAAHICAASANGPRYDAFQNAKARKSIYNAIWLCHNCSDLIDKDHKLYTVILLHEWKKIHKIFLRENLGKRIINDKILTRGGNGGQIYIITESLEGGGIITADGGDGDIGGQGGKIYIDAKKNNYKGVISAQAGKSWKK